MLRLYSFFPEQTVSAYERQKAWRARQAEYADIRLGAARSTTSSIFSARISYVQQIGDIAVRQAVQRMTASVDKTV